MLPVCLCDVDRSGLVVAMAARGIAAVRIDRRALPAAAGRRALMIGWHPAAAAIVAVRRAWPGPLMVLIANGGERDLVAALDGGADEAMLDRAGDALIAARLAALLRRQDAARPIRLGELTIDPLERRVTRAGRSVDLLPREYALLLHLVRRAGEVIDRASLREAIWGLEFDPGTNVIEVHVSRLRAKLDRGFASPMLLTEKGRGYRLVAAAQSPIAGGAGAV